MQAAINIHPGRTLSSAIQRKVRARLTWSNAVRVGLAAIAIVAVPLDMNHRIFGPAPNWPLIVTEPVALIAFLRCTLGSIR